MLITQQFYWPAVNWPDINPATQYTVFQIYPGDPVALQNVVTTSATLEFDDTQNLVYQIRPSSGDLPTPTVGPEITTFVIGYVPCRAWIRQKVRMALADRVDSASNLTPTWPDDELNQLITEAFGELNVLFPVERDVTITLLPPTIDPVSGASVGVRNYPLPSDYFEVDTVLYQQQNRQPIYLKKKPWKGGESSGTAFTGHVKLGVVLYPTVGRFYSGHYYTYENQLWIDWDAEGNLETLVVNYQGRRPLPTGDADIFEETTLEDMELISLYTQMKAWIRIEGNDTRLSRWIENSKRDGLPTVKHSTVIKNLYNERVNDRRETRPRVLRLVRR